MKQIAISKRKVNRTKRAKVGSHGLKVYKNTVVYIGKETENKSGVKPEILETITTIFNTDKSIRKMVKHIKHISIRYAPSCRFAGMWTSDKQKFTFNDDSHIRPEHAEEIVYHEIVGHAFWDWAQKWRAEEWKAFNDLANKMPPVNDYVATYLKHRVDYRTNTIYENEQHSAITELMKHGSSYHVANKDMTEDQLKQLKEAWELLHY